MGHSYQTDGFSFHPDLLGEKNASVMQNSVDQILSVDQPDTRIIHETDGKTPRTILNPHLWNDVFERVTRHPSILAEAESLLGEPVYIWQMGINCKQAFNGDIWFWHQDYPAYRIDDHIPTSRMVNVLIFLDEVTHFNGPLMLVPGSHKTTDENPQYSAEGTSYTFRYTDRSMIEDEICRGGIVAPTGPAGSVIFMDVNTLHGSAGNLSPWPRRMITMTLNAISNKASSPSTRPIHIVPDDTNASPLVPLATQHLLEAGH